MNKIKITLVFSIASLFLHSCHDEDSRYLNNCYMYVKDGPSIKRMLSLNKDNIDIYSEIVRYSYNKDYIIAIQTPDLEDYKFLISARIRLKMHPYETSVDTDIRSTESKALNILRSDSFYKKIFSNDTDYWIITCNGCKTLGPFSKNEYIEERIQLNIPDTLE